jgi:hypothetical protein
MEDLGYTFIAANSLGADMRTAAASWGGARAGAAAPARRRLPSAEARTRTDARGRPDHGRQGSVDASAAGG